jgi:hypothetical protein
MKPTNLRSNFGRIGSGVGKSKRAWKASAAAAGAAVLAIPFASALAGAAVAVAEIVVHEPLAFSMAGLLCVGQVLVMRSMDDYVQCPECGDMFEGRGMLDRHVQSTRAEARVA